MAVTLLDAWLESKAARTISAGTDRLLVFFWIYENDNGDQTLNTVNYGTTPMTKVGVVKAGTGDFQYYVGIFILLDADIETGSNAFTTDASDNTPTGETHVNATLENVDQTTPVPDTGNCFSNSSSSGCSNTVDVVDEGYCAGISAPSSAGKATTWDAGLAASPLGELTINGASANLGVLSVTTTETLTVTASCPTASRYLLFEAFFAVGGAPPPVVSSIIHPCCAQLIT